VKINIIAGATRNLGAPPNWDPNGPPCEVLPIRDDDVGGIPCMVSSWQPTQEEIDLIVAGAAIELWIGGTVHPPVSPMVARPT
jgi:hypothetical protein